MVLEGPLACGILSSALYIGGDIVGAMRYSGYNYASQVISELLAEPLSRPY